MSIPTYSVRELGAFWGWPERTMRDSINGLTPDYQGTGNRGDPNKYAVDRVARHLYATRDDHDDPLILEEQRARQAKETADKLALENAVTRGELVPPEVAAQESERFVRRIIAFMDSLPAAFVRLLPHLEANDHARIRRTLIHERNQFAQDLASSYGEAASAPGDADHDDARSAA